jgi:alkylated DNA repair protein (DNA oxidative demethylase)
MTASGELFPALPDDTRSEWLEAGAVVLRAFARREADALLAGIAAVTDSAPFRHLETAGGKRMSVAMTNCGALGWISDRRGYRYSPLDPLSGKPWPAMPPFFRDLAVNAAAAAGFAGFTPDACLVNRYEPGARMALHQDRDERDLQAPIVSVSLGLPAVFLFGGPRRDDAARRIPLAHGDVAVWGGPARLRFHGVLALKPGTHPLGLRYNLTFRQAG